MWGSIRAFLGVGAFFAFICGIFYVGGLFLAWLEGYPWLAGAFIVAVFVGMIKLLFAIVRAGFSK